MGPGGSAVTVTIGGNAQPLQKAIDDANQSLKQFSNQGQNLGGMFSAITSPLQGFASALGGAVSGMIGFISNALEMATGMGLYNMFDTLIMKAKQFGDEMFNLEVTTERAQYGWGYMFSGQGGTPQANLAQGQQRATDLMAWSKQFSYSVPFTRQDLIQSITTLGGSGMTEAQIKQYMPMIADLAATQGAARGLTLSQTSQAIQGAMFGITRQLRYDLMIDPNQLAALGYNSGDPSTLMPALYKWTQQRGELGAAKGASTQTWYGAYSSFQDRIQNFQLAVGQDAFQGLKTQLNDFTDFWDAHQKDIDAFAAVVGGDLANALLALGGAVRDFIAGWQGGGAGFWASLGDAAGGGLKDLVALFQGAGAGLGDSGAWTAVANAVTAIGTTLNNPQVQATLAMIGKLAAQEAGTAVKDVANAVTAIAAVGANTQVQTALRDIVAFAGMTAGNALTIFGTMVGALAAIASNKEVIAVVGGLVHFLTTLATINQSAIMGILGGIASGIAAMAKNPFVLQMLAIGVNALHIAFGDLAMAWNQLMAAIPPPVRVELQQLLQLMGSAIVINGIMLLVTVLEGVAFAAELLTGFINFLTFAIKNAWQTGLSWGTNLLNLWNTITTFLNNVGQGFDNFIQNAIDWGGQLILNFIDGIQSHLPNLGDVIGGIVNMFNPLAHHSPPTVGPLHDDDQWMPNMMRMFAAGIEQNTPLVAAASNNAAAAIQQALGGVQPGGAGGGMFGNGDGMGGPSLSYGDISYSQTYHGMSDAMMQKAINDHGDHAGRVQANIRQAPGNLRLGLS